MFTLNGALIGLHLGGWNGADSPPPSPEGAAASSVADRDKHAAARARLNADRAVAMGLGNVGSATRKSVVDLARQVNTGSYALYLGTAAIASMCHASLTGSGGGGDSSGGKAGKKRART